MTDDRPPLSFGEVDLAALKVCQLAGHAYAGCVDVSHSWLLGRCERCGLGILTDGS